MFDQRGHLLLSVLPLDDFVDDPLRRMAVVGDPVDVPDVQQAVIAACRHATGLQIAAAPLERFAFYDAARAAFAVVQAGDPRPYGCFLIRKGVVFPNAGNRVKAPSEGPE